MPGHRTCGEVRKSSVSACRITLQCAGEKRVRFASALEGIAQKGHANSRLILQLSSGPITHWAKLAAEQARA